MIKFSSKTTKVTELSSTFDTEGMTIGSLKAWFKDLTDRGFEDSDEITIDRFTLCASKIITTEIRD